MENVNAACSELSIDHWLYCPSKIVAGHRILKIPPTAQFLDLIPGALCRNILEFIYAKEDIMKLLRIAFLLAVLAGPGLLNAANGGLKFAHCVEVLNANHQYDLYEMKSDQVSSYYAVVKDESNDVLVGPADQAVLLDQGQSLSLQFSAIRILVRKGQKTSGMVWAYDSATDMKCDASW